MFLKNSLKRSPFSTLRYNLNRLTSNSTINRSFSKVGRNDVRNIGISAHIDSGKTTLTERILYYTGKIDSIHDVRGKDGVGAKMDSMDLEREKGITIQSAATYCEWKDNQINIIDTPGHVDFTIEVERALRVLDGAILVVCAVGGVQSQTLTVDRQMKRYNIPRLAFINKLDRVAANPWPIIDGIKSQLKLPAVAMQIPIGLEDQHEGVVDLLEMEAIRFGGEKGEELIKSNIPEDLIEEATTRREELIEVLVETDEEIGELFLMEEEPTIEQLRAAIRRQTIDRKLVPVFMGSAFKNKGVQSLLDGVTEYLPSPGDVENIALDTANNEAEVSLKCSPSEPLVALAFKLEESRFGQLTYLRIYQGSLKKGASVINVTSGKKVRIPRIVRMHSNEMQDVDSATAGDVVAVFGVSDVASMDTFTDGTTKLALNSMFVPAPVMSLSVKPKDTLQQVNFGKAIGKFTREDPTLRVAMDPKSKETVMSGMGELHLDIYIERMKREYNVECITGEPSVNYKETISRKVKFNYLHKKQSGGSGQYGRVMGYLEPLNEEELQKGTQYIFDNHVIGTNIPPEFIPSCEKGAIGACEQGALAGYPLSGVRIVLEDGQAHSVDSSDLAFQLAMQYAIVKAVKEAAPKILEPIMLLEVSSPAEFQGAIMGGLNKRNGLIMATEVNDDGSQVAIKAEMPLSQMFGYSTDLRSSTQGKGEFSMEYKHHNPVNRDQQEQLIADFIKSREAAAN